MTACQSTVFVGSLRAIKEIGKQGGERTHVGSAKDGSSVGAVLIALVADRIDKNGRSKTVICGHFLLSLCNGRHIIWPPAIIIL
jgi:hypothetical protein